MLPVLEGGTVAQIQRAAATFLASPFVQVELVHITSAQPAAQDQAASGKDQERYTSPKQQGGKH